MTEQLPKLDAKTLEYVRDLLAKEYEFSGDTSLLRVRTQIVDHIREQQEA